MSSTPPFIRFIHGSITSKWIILVRYFIHWKNSSKAHPNHIQITSKSSMRFLVHFFFFPNSDVSNLPKLKKNYFHEFSCHRSYQTSGVDVVLSTWPPKKKKKVTQLPGYHRSCHRSWEILFSRFLCWADSVGEFDLKFLSFSALHSRSSTFFNNHIKPQSATWYCIDSYGYWNFPRSEPPKWAPIHSAGKENKIDIKNTDKKKL